MFTKKNSKGTKENPAQYFQINESKFAIAKEFESESEKAYLINVINVNCGSNKTYWIPKSLLGQSVNKHGQLIVTLPDWYVNKTFGWIA